MKSSLRRIAVACVAVVALLISATPAMAMIGPYGYGSGTDGRCLTETFSTTTLAHVTVEPCNGSNTQKWFHYAVSYQDGYTVETIKSGASGRCMDASDVGKTMVYFWMCSEDDRLDKDLLWIVGYHDVGGGNYYYSFESFTKRGWCLDVMNDGRGPTVGTHPCHRRGNQLFKQA